MNQQLTYGAFCPNCGHPVSTEAPHCPTCGHPLPPSVKPKSKAITLLLCFFLGGFGVHRFYLRDYGLGVAYPLGFICSAVAWPPGVALLSVVLLIDFIVLAFLGKSYYQARSQA